MNFYKFLIPWVFTIGFFLGGMLINILINNRPETIYIAEGLVTCKDRGGLAYLPTSGINARCKDGGLIKRAEGPEVIAYYNYIKDKQVLGVNFINYVDFDYDKINGIK